MLLKKIFNRLEGIWKFHRKLRDKITNVSYGSAIGTAIFEKTGNHILFYREEGVLIFQAEKPLKIYQEYCYAYSEKNDSIVKYFSKNKEKLGFMYELNFAISKTAKVINAKGKHICINDAYQANFIFPKNEFDNFSVIYDVIGTNKNYLSETFYERELRNLRSQIVTSS